MRMITGMTGNQHFILSLGRLANVDPALEVGALVDRDAPCGNIPGQRTFTADVNTVGGIDIPAYPAQNHHFTGRDIRRHQRCAAGPRPASISPRCRADRAPAPRRGAGGFQEHPCSDSEVQGHRATSFADGSETGRSTAAGTALTRSAGFRGAARQIAK